MVPHRPRRRSCAGRARSHLPSLLGAWCRATPGAAFASAAHAFHTRTHVLVLASLAGNFGSALGRGHSQRQELGPGLKRNVNPFEVDKSKSKLRNEY